MTTDSTSGFLNPEDLTSQWTEVTLLQARRRNVLYRAKRYGRWFILKTLSEDCQDLTDYRLLQERECQIGFSLHHPNIVETYSIEEVPAVGRCIVIEYVDGTTLALGPCEYAAGRDLARFPVDGRRPALELRADLPDVGERITVLGNTDGRGVMTEIDGRIVGVGPTELEIDAAFTTGNSGSPVLDRAGRVVAVATYLRDCRDDRDWSKRHTRFNGIRRFALRLSGVTWERVR